MGSTKLDQSRTSGPIGLVLRTARRLLNRREKMQLVAVAILVLLGVGLELVSLGLFLPVISLLTDAETVETIRERVTPLGEASSTQIVATALAVIIIVFFVKSCVSVGSLWFQRTVVAHISTRLSQELFDRYLRQSYLFHVRSNSASLIRNVQNASALVSSGVDPLISLATDGLIAVGIVILLLLVEPLPALAVVVLYGTVGFGLFKTLRSRVRELGESRNTHNAMTLKNQQQGLSAIKTLIVTGRREVFSREHHQHVLANNLVTRTYGLMQQLPRLWIEMLTVSSLSGLVLIVILQDREVSDSIPILGLFALAAFRIQPSITRILLSLQALTFSSAAVASVEQDSVSPVDDFGDLSEPLEFEELLVDAVSFAYSVDSTPILRNVSLRIGRGERVGISGRSGAGKTTLVDLMLGLLAPTKGEVRVNGNEILPNPSAWQRSIGFVPQDVYLIDDSIERNVAFGLPLSEDVRHQVLVALDGSQLGDFVRGLPDGLSTVVGERGMRLSGGQRQRIGIARALMGNPRVMVFDEATSSLDGETERDVLAAIDAVAADRTMIVIAHRASTLSICDRILRVEGGSVIDLGPPTAALLQRLAGEDYP